MSLSILDGSAGKIRTDSLIHRTIETGNRTTTLRSDVPDFEVNWIVPRVRTALGGGTAPFPNTRFSLDVDPDGTIPRRTVRYTVYHPGTGPMHATVAPPDSDGAPARLDVSAAELLERVASGSIDPEAFMAAGGLVRRVAWAWLSMRGYSR